MVEGFGNPCLTLGTKGGKVSGSLSGDRIVENIQVAFITARGYIGIHKPTILQSRSNKVQNVEYLIHLGTERTGSLGLSLLKCIHSAPPYCLTNLVFGELTPVYLLHGLHHLVFAGLIVRPLKLLLQLTNSQCLLLLIQIGITQDVIVRGTVYLHPHRIQGRIDSVVFLLPLLVTLPTRLGYQPCHHIHRTRFGIDELQSGKAHTQLSCHWSCNCGKFSQPSIISLLPFLIGFVLLIPLWSQRANSTPPNLSCLLIDQTLRLEPHNIIGLQE